MEESVADIMEIREGAGFGIRALARILDTGFGYALGLAAGLVGGLALVILESAGLIDYGWQTRIEESSALPVILSLFGVFFYHSFCEGIHGSTLGKMICRLQVVSVDGTPGKAGGAIVRSLAWFLDGLVFGLVGYSSMNKSPLNQRYGDVWGKTLVIKTSQVPEASRRSLARFFIGLFLGMNAWILMLALGLVLQGM